MSDGSYNLYPLNELDDSLDWKNSGYSEVIAIFRTAADKGVLRFLHISCINALNNGLIKPEIFVSLLVKSYEVAIEAAIDTDSAIKLKKEKENFQSNYRKITAVDLDGMEQ